MVEIKLYDYQQDMKQQIDAAFKSYQSVMVQMPTGTGKTHLLASVVKEAMDRDTDCVVWIIAHRKELVDQIERTVMNFGIEIDHKNPANCQVRVYSIQWLSRHIDELGDLPSLVIIDEAHHALANTYSTVLGICSATAKCLGLTATPCRLNGRGFGDLFDTLLYAKPINQFIKDGYLSPFDYISIPSDSDEARKIDLLVKRAADGDYNVSEMNDILNTRPSIERLYSTIDEFAKDKKGITYAINIDHAENIADYYRSKGLRAEAISSKSPDKERDRLVREFDDGTLQVLVNVDIFSEGFDCPDVEFIQMARPTLSLAKYLQQVGRGLRVFNGKKCCILLDNVGLYRLFGLPTNDWNWQAMFDGRRKGKGEIFAERIAYMKLMERNVAIGTSDDSDTRMVVITTHDNLQETIELFNLVSLIGEDLGKVQQLEKGWLMPKAYITKGTPHKLYRKVGQRNFGHELMIDAEGVYYTFLEQTEKLIKIGKLQPWTKFIDQNIIKNRFTTKSMPTNLAQRHTEYIWDAECFEADEVHRFKDRYYLGKGNAMFLSNRYLHISKAVDGIRSYEDENGDKGIMNQDGNYYLLSNKSHIQLLNDGMVYVRDILATRGRWVNVYTMQEFEEKPEIVKMGFTTLLKVGDDYFIHKARMMAGIALKREDFEYNNDVFQFFNNYVILRSNPKVVLFLDKGYNKNYVYNFKLTEIRSLGTSMSDFGYITQMQLPCKVTAW